MTALQLIQAINNVLFVSIVVLTAAAAFRRRTRIALDTAVFSGALACVVLEGPVLQLLGISASAASTAIVSILVMALPYLVLQLRADFTNVPLLARAITLGGLFAAAIVPITSAIPLSSATASGTTDRTSLTSSRAVRPHRGPPRGAAWPGVAVGSPLRSGRPGTARRAPRHVGPPAVFPQAFP